MARCQIVPIQKWSLLTELNLFILVLFNFFSINTLIDCIQNSNGILTFIRAMLKTIRENYLDRSSFHLKCHQNNTHTPLLIKATTHFIFCFLTWGTNHFLDLPRCKILISKQIFGPFKTQKFMTKRLLYLFKKTYMALRNSNCSSQHDSSF